jgi:hypothetical protein
MLHHLKDLSPDQKRAIENLLGRQVSEDESVSIKSIRPSAIIPPHLSPEERKESLEKFTPVFCQGRYATDAGERKRRRGNH